VEEWNCSSVLACSDTGSAGAQVRSGSGGQATDAADPNVAESQPAPHVRSEMAGPWLECFVRWQQHLLRQQAADNDEVSHCAASGVREANHISTATGTAVQPRR
jgi:hypothetical protein